MSYGTCWRTWIRCVESDTARTGLTRHRARPWEAKKTDRFGLEAVGCGCFGEPADEGNQPIASEETDDQLSSSAFFLNALANALSL